MQIEVANQRIMLLRDRISPVEAQEKAWQKKVSAFDALSKVTSFLSRPKDEDFSLTYSEHRYEPFWHVVATARYEYTRTSNYQVAVPQRAVKNVTVHDNKYDVLNGHIHIPVLEYCLQEEKDESLIDGMTGKQSPQLQQYVSMGASQIEGQIRDHVDADAILVPPQARVSGIMRDSLSKMITGIQADTIIDEHVEVNTVDLYYRPMYAFKYMWAAKAKEGILEVDGLTGETRTGTRVFTEYLGKVLDQNFLFDIGADAVGMFVPGGSIAVKAAKKYIDTRTSNNK
jgi:hypothetical protein